MSIILWQIVNGALGFLLIAVAATATFLGALGVLLGLLLGVGGLIVAVMAIFDYGDGEEVQPV